MFQRFAAILLLSAMLAGTSQAFTVTLSGFMNLTNPVGPPPAGYLGDGNYAFTAVMQAEPVPSVNPGALTSASLDLTSAGFGGPFSFPGGLVTITDGVSDSASFTMAGPPGTSSVTFDFVNANNVISNSLPNNDNVAAIIKGQSSPPLAINVSGFLFDIPGFPGSVTVGPITSVTSTIVATPEPSSFALLGALAVGGVVYRRRRRAKAAA